MAIVVKKSPGYTSGNLKITGTAGGVSIKTTPPAPAGPINPGTVAGLSLWYNPDAISQASPSNLTAWVDSSGNGEDLTGASGYAFALQYDSTGATGPVYGVARGPFVIRSNSGFYPTLQRLSSGAPTGSSARTIYAAGKSVSGGTDERSMHMFGWGSSAQMGKCALYRWGGGPDGGNPGYLGMSFGENGGSDPSGIYHAVPTNTTALYPLTSTGQPFILSWAYTAGSAVSANPLYINGLVGGGKTALQSATNQVLNTVNDNLLVAKGPWTGYVYTGFWSGWIGDIIVYNTAHDATTRQGIELYLSTKYSIPLTGL